MKPFLLTFSIVSFLMQVFLCLAPWAPPFSWITVFGGWACCFVLLGSFLLGQLTYKKFFTKKT